MECFNLSWLYFFSCFLVITLQSVLSNDVYNTIIELNSVFYQVQSSEELANLFEYDFDAYWDTKSEAFGDGASSLKDCKSRLNLLDRASDYNLFSFVTHRNSQVIRGRKWPQTSCCPTVKE